MTYQATEQVLGGGLEMHWRSSAWSWVGAGKSTQGGRQRDDLRRDGQRRPEGTVMEWPTAGMEMGMSVLPVVMGLFEWRWVGGECRIGFL
jgi:hypothetical protein